MTHVLVTGATGQIGSEVLSQLRGTDCRVRAKSRNPRAANLPTDVEIVRGDLSAPDTLDACLNGIESVFLVWMAPPLTQREQVQIVGEAIGRPLRFEELSRESAREQMLAMRFPPFAADMLLDAYAAAVDCRRW